MRGHGCPSTAAERLNQPSEAAQESKPTNRWATSGLRVAWQQPWQQPLLSSAEAARCRLGVRVAFQSIAPGPLDRDQVLVDRSGISTPHELGELRSAQLEHELLDPVVAHMHVHLGEPALLENADRGDVGVHDLRV